MKSYISKDNMFRPFIGSSSGPLEIKIQELSAFFMRYGIPHAYRIKCGIMRYMRFLYINYCGSRRL